MMYFYTDVYGISAAAVGTMFGISRLWNSLNDPIMGVIADRTKSKHGRFRPWLLWMALPMIILGIATFSTPDFEMRGKLIYAYIIYNLMMMGYTAINIPYSALMGVVTSDPQERTTLASFRFVGAFSGGLIINAFLLKLVAATGGDNEAAGWQRAMAIFGSAAAVLFLTTFLTVKERVQPPKDQKNNLKNDLKDLLTNVPWLVIQAVAILFLIGFSVRNSTAMYYFKYFAADEGGLKLLWFTADTHAEYVTLFLTIGSVGSLTCTLSTPLFTKLMGKKMAFIMLGSVSAMLAFVYFYLPPNAIMAMLGLQFVFSFLMGPMSPIIWSIYTDCADYSEWKNNRRATGLVMSASTFAQGLGWTVAGITNGWLLAGFGYVANQEQTPHALRGILLMMSIIPAGLQLLCMGIVFFYPLNEKKMKQIETDLTERRAANEALES
jgi:GPH family glycoside/pentoside/hexuronide:cation symporter